MLSLETEARLSRLIIALSDLERKIELKRQILARKPRFEPFTAFQRLRRDHPRQKQVEYRDIINFCSEFGISVSTEQAKEIIRIYDMNGDGLLDYSEFLILILPRENHALRGEAATQRPIRPINPGDKLDPEVESALASVLEAELRLGLDTELLKEDLEGRHDFVMEEAFARIDLLQQGFLDVASIIKFLRANDYVPSETEIQAFIRRLDANMDGVLSYSEFCSGIMTRQGGYVQVIRTSSRQGDSGRSKRGQGHGGHGGHGHSGRSGRSRSRSRSPSPIEKESPNMMRSSKYSQTEGKPTYNALTVENGRGTPTPDKSFSRYTEASPGQIYHQDTSLKSPYRSYLVNPTPHHQTVNIPEYNNYNTYLMSSGENKFGGNQYQHPKSESMGRMAVDPVDPVDPVESIECYESTINKSDPATFFLIRIMKEQIEIERYLEVQKQNLALKSDFDLSTAFSSFDPYSMGNLGTHELGDGFRLFGVNPTPEEMFLYLQRYDSDQDGRISYSDFCECFLPSEPGYSRLLYNRRSSYSSHFTESTWSAFAHTIRRILDVETEREMLRNRVRDGGYDLLLAFTKCDRMNKLYFGLGDLRHILQMNGVKASHQDLVTLMSIYDRNKDGKITFDEFERELTPYLPSFSEEENRMKHYSPKKDFQTQTKQAIPPPVVKEVKMESIAMVDVEKPKESTPPPPVKQSAPPPPPKPRMDPKKLDRIEKILKKGGLRPNVMDNIKKHRQEDLLRFVEEYDDDQLERFIMQLHQIDFEQIDHLFDDLCADNKKKADKPGTIKPLSPDMVYARNGLTEAQVNHFKMQGAKAIVQGKVALIVLAAGAGTRLGSSDPKGMYNIGLPSQTSIFETLVKRFQRVQEYSKELGGESDTGAHLYIMTSESNHEATINFFKQQNFFGADSTLVHFFTQPMLPAVDFKGNIILQEKEEISFSPNGNGGIFGFFQNHPNFFPTLAKAGIEYLNIIGIDNVLCRMLDPLMIGLSILKKKSCIVKTIPKMDPDEKVGIFALADGKADLIEYSELTHEQANQTDSQGNLAFSQGNIVNMMVSLKALRDITGSSGGDIGQQYHKATKKIPHVDAQGKKVVPTKNCGYKFELFINSFIPYLTKSIIFLEVNREEEFAPVKNPPSENVDSAVSARELTANLHAKWLAIAGADIRGNVGSDPRKLVEISPLISYEGENLMQYQGTKFNLPLIIDENT